ncbi:MAG TPA: DUF58 domain-containing protein [Kofleriaceae bacterium]|nr:DUF58 domain-containing protein [Kofleriaceae bacterium]
MLPAEIAQAVKRIQFVTGKDVADVMAGAYVSVFKGRGMEFDEVRPYVPGDDVRAIDWNVTARTGEAHVKRFVEERELTVMLLVDISASQEFGSGRRSKLEAAAELSALLALSATSNDDKVGLLLFHGEADLYIPPRKGSKHALRVIREVLARGGSEPATVQQKRMITEWPGMVRRWWQQFRSKRTSAAAAANTGAGRATSIGAALEFCRKVLPRRTVLFLISDFVDENYLDVLRHASRKHDVVAALVTDPREQQMPPAGLVTLVDAETGATRLVDTQSATFRDELAKVAAQRHVALTDALRASRIDLVTFDASGSMVDPLLRFFRERKRGRR